MGRSVVALLSVALALLVCAPMSFAAHGTFLDSLTRFFDGMLPEKNSVNETTHWALLIAGSAGYGNYRHQADIAHAYQLLKAGGLQDEHIIVMMADDVAFSFENPHPGELYNRPGGPEVYKGLKPDYTGFKVTAKNFLAVLAGDKKKLEPAAEGGRVLASGPSDRVFVYYADHGAPGILGMPFGSFLYADEFISTLEKKAKGGFSEMVMFIEACESGSMFEGLLNAELPIYVTTAANSHESSWGTYCPGMQPSPPKEFTTCLGDLYSVAWMEEVDELMLSDQLSTETLSQLYKHMSKRVSNNFTYRMGSHVMQYGNLKMAQEDLSEVVEEEAPQPSTWAQRRLPDWMTSLHIMAPGQGADAAAADMDTSSSPEQQQQGSGSSGGGRSRLPPLSDSEVQAVEARDAELLHLWAKHSAAAEGADKAAAEQALDEALSSRRRADKAVRSAVLRLLATSNGAGTLKMMFAPLLSDVPSGNNNGDGPPATAMTTLLSLPEEGDARLAELVVTTPPPPAPHSASSPDNEGLNPPPARPVVQDFDCLRGMVAQWEAGCGQMDGYSMKYTRPLATLCDAGFRPPSVGEALALACSEAAAIQQTGARADVPATAQA